MYSYVKLFVKFMGISYSLYTIVSQTKIFSRGNIKKQPSHMKNTRNLRMDFFCHMAYNDRRI